MTITRLTLVIMVVAAIVIVARTLLALRRLGRARHDRVSGRPPSRR